jgi:universal stress protein A
VRRGDAPARFRSVIASTDFSDVASAALPHAFQLARDHGASLSLVHVLDAYPLPSPLYAHYYPIPTPDQQRRAERKARAALRACIPADLGRSRRVTLLVVHGDPAREILRVADESEAPVIVIASHGRTGLARLALGSVAERVIRAAHCPVLVVR